MKSGHHTQARTIARSVLGGICLAGIASGCGGSVSTTDAAGELSENSQGETASLSQELRPSSRGQAQGTRRRRHHAGHSGGAHGGGSPPVPVACGPVDQDVLFQTINADLARLDADDRSFARYLTLADRARVLGCGAALDGERAALNKLINSVSINAVVQSLVPIDADQTIYRLDLRDFDWNRPIAVGAARFSDAWEALIA